MNNKQSRILTRFTPIDTVRITAAAGVNGWVDTNCSATVGTDTTKLWLISIYSVGGAVNHGARAHGSALEPRVPASPTGFIASYCDASGHIDLYREAGGDTHYDFWGYLS